VAGKKQGKAACDTPGQQYVIADIQRVPLSNVKYATVEGPALAN
jgi:hypothetical protein